MEFSGLQGIKLCNKDAHETPLQILPLRVFFEEKDEMLKEPFYCKVRGLADFADTIKTQTNSPRWNIVDTTDDNGKDDFCDHVVGIDFGETDEERDAGSLPLPPSCSFMRGSNSETSSFPLFRLRSVVLERSCTHSCEEVRRTIRRGNDG